MSRPAAGRLALDEMFSPAIAAALRELGHDVVAAAERVDLRSMTDDDLFAWSAAQHRWLLTENVKDFRPIMLRALQARRCHHRLAVHQQPGVSAFQAESGPADSGDTCMADQRPARSAAEGGLASRPR